MRTKYAACVLLGLACTAPAGFAAAQPPAFTVQLQEAIPSSPGGYGAITGMNNRGELVGYYEKSDEARSYIWRNGKATPLKDIAVTDSYDGSDLHYVRALGINDAGAIVGQALLDPVVAPYGGVIWSSSSAEPVALPQATRHADASAINNKGLVGGMFWDPPGSQHDAAVLWRSGNPTMMWPGNAGDPDGLLNGRGDAYRVGVGELNERDQAVGYVLTPHREDPFSGHWNSRTQAIFWDGERSQLLKGPEAGWEFTDAWALNDGGLIVGQVSQYDPKDPDSFWGAAAAIRAVSWADGVTQFLDGTESAEFSGAYDVNNHGWIVGGIDGDAVLWLDGQALRLDSLLDGTAADLGAFDLRNALFVNDRGQILVSGLLNGSQHYALLTPVPEPSTMALALGGLAVLTWRARKAGSSRGQA